MWKKGNTDKCEHEKDKLIGAYKAGRDKDMRKNQRVIRLINRLIVESRLKNRTNDYFRRELKYQLSQLRQLSSDKSDIKQRDEVIKKMLVSVVRNAEQLKKEGTGVRYPKFKMQEALKKCEKDHFGKECGDIQSMEYPFDSELQGVAVKCNQFTKAVWTENSTVCEARMLNPKWVKDQSPNDLRVDFLYQKLLE